MSNKRGVSPLIATVLLIAFAVALGAVVMNWGKTYVEEQAEDVQERSDQQIVCTTDVDMKWWKRGSTKKVCYGPGYVFFMVENSGTRDLTDLKLIIDGENDVFINQSILNATFIKADVKRFNVSYDNATYGTVMQVILTPSIDIGGKTKICTGRELVESDPQACT
ncbi:MAG: hypothetical protein KJ709_06880 [Nanoarchaeota archaeon]|nr:hypothetical protein [Nanoarchaeota archaeon]